MNRAAMGLGLSAGIIVLIVIAIFMTFTRNVRAADGSPKQLREITAKEMEMFEKSIPAEAKAKPVKPRKILVFWLCKGFFHECIPVANKAIELMGKKTGAYEVVTSDDMNVFDANKLAEFDGILFNNTTKLEFKDSQKKALMDFVKGGKGIIGIHAATDNFYTWPEAAAMMGGTFVYHPWTANGTWAIKNTDPNHPINSSFKGEGFKIRDEIYRQKLLRLRENCRVILSLDMDDPVTKAAKGAQESDKDMPVSWLRNFEKGRVFYCGLGHNNEVYFNPAVLQHYLDGIQFGLGDLKADVAPNTKSEETK